MTMMSSGADTREPLNTLDTEGSATGALPDLFPDVSYRQVISRIGSCSYLTVVPSGGFLTSSATDEFGAVLSSCFEWMDSSQVTEPQMPLLAGSVRMSRVVARRRLEPAPLDENDFT